jgi:transposase
MTTTRKRHSPKFKAQVVLEAIRGEKTLSQLGSQFKVHPIQIAKWRKAALEHLAELFVDGRTRQTSGQAETDALYQQIGRLKVELDWLKKKVGIADSGERPVHSGGAAFEDAGYLRRGLGVFPAVAQFLGVFDLLRGEGGLASEFYASRLRCGDTGAGALPNVVTLHLGEDRGNLHHGAA